MFRPHRSRVFLLIIGVFLLLAAFFFYPAHNEPNSTTDDPSNPVWFQALVFIVAAITARLIWLHTKGRDKIFPKK